ncbi:unnamed protein product [Protopolystoma xenopodis]|uniref:Uncharacterized protein n=1 Tax=Protopolystoma xenopodis TaxID=117903 RepID=A0A448XFU4_9PLAT|nr:unnamed protein product [Protopolystoma xenopodis]
MTYERLAPFYRNRRRLTRKQRRHECSTNSNPPSSSGGIDLRISSPNTFTRNGIKFNNYQLEVGHFTELNLGNSRGQNFHRTRFREDQSRVHQCQYSRLRYATGD